MNRIDLSKYINVRGESTPHVKPAEVEEVQVLPSIERPGKNNIFNWDIEETPIYFYNGELIPGHKAIIRNDTGRLLQVCKNTYTPTYNRHFTETVENFVSVTGYQIAEAKSFDYGGKLLVWLKGEVNNIGGLPTENYLLLGNSHDSSTAFFVGNTSHIIRCRNQFTNRNQQLRAHHTSNIHSNIRAITQTIEQLHSQNELLRIKFEKFDYRKFTNNERKLFIKSLFEVEENEELTTQKENKIIALNEAISQETRDINNSFWGLFMGVTYYTTHLLREKEKTFGNVFGQSSEINNKAFKILNEML